MRKNLTAQFVETAKTKKPREVFWDEKTPGFGLRVTSNGARSWVVMYDYNGRARMMTLGTYPAMRLADARERGREALLAAQKGADPAGEKQAERSADTWGALCARYLAEVQGLRPKTAYEYRRTIERVLLPRWRNHKAKDVTRAEVKSLVASIRVEGHAVMANRVLALVSIIANYGVREEVLDFNPAAQIEKTTEESRDRVLSDDEIKKAWGELGTPARLLLLTATRRGEVAGMRWSEIEGDVWTVPKERSKNGTAHRVALVGEAAKIVAGIPRDGDKLFANERRFRRDCRTDGNYHIHDLRRTCATKLAELGVDEVVIKRILNHSRKGDVTNVYNRHEYDAEKRAALVKWDAEVRRIVTGERESAKVIDFR